MKIEGYYWGKCLKCRELMYLPDKIKVCPDYMPTEHTDTLQPFPWGDRDE